jgi:hypothetical protein
MRLDPTLCFVRDDQRRWHRTMKVGDAWRERGPFTLSMRVGHTGAIGARIDRELLTYLCYA